MKPKTTFTKKDLITTLACIVFLLLTVAAVGPRGRRHAKEVLCRSNLQKLGVCFQTFLKDNNGYFQEGYAGLPDCSSTNWWFHALKPYYQNQTLRLCPMATVMACDIGSERNGSTFVAWYGESWFGPIPDGYGSYGLNGWVENNRCPDEPENNKRRRWRHAAASGAGNIPLLLDAAWIDGWPSHIDAPPEYYDQDWRLGSNMTRFCINRHEGFINSLFLDFSARKVGLKELWTLKWHRQYDTCGPYTICGGMQPQDWPDWMLDFEDY
jgi:hypothetical protein